jgi:hypothetical protein
MGWIFGYVNASWTLKVDMAAAYICRLLKHMDQKGIEVVTARAPHGQAQDESIVGALQSGYAQRGSAVLPRQGKGLPWRILHSPEKDHVMLLKDPVDDAALEFGAAPAGRGAAPRRAPVSVGA